MTKSTIAALDLGGGSTQVTYVPKDISKTPLYKNYMHSVRVLNSKIDVFTTSYLHAGLMAVRHAVFTNGHPKNLTNIESECVNPIVKNKRFVYGNENYYISGKENPKDTTENPVVDYDLCEKNVKAHLQPLIKPSPVTLKQHNIAAFSYFYDRAIETGLVGKLRWVNRKGCPYLVSPFFRSFHRRRDYRWGL
jgi:ectonucleoside triphosphate diphosphohydrolase 5/6